jgi:hypothetical protein
MEWLEKCFEPTTREKANGATRLLIYDGHGSHVTGSFLSHCLKHDIQVVLLLPHTSHLLQPLDVGVFSPLKHYLSRNLDKLVRTGIAKVEKCEWVECFAKARPLALTSKNIQSGFKATGIYPPIDRSKVLDKFPLREPINATSQNNTAEQCPATPEAGDITIAYKLRENPILDTPMLNILENKLAEKKTTDVFDSAARDLFQSMLYACRVKNHDGKIKDRELKECHDVLGARKERKNGRRVILKGHHVVIYKETVDKLVQAEEAAKAAAKAKRPRGRSRKIVVAKEPDSDEESNSDEEGGCECS